MLIIMNIEWLMVTHRELYSKIFKNQVHWNKKDNLTFTTTGRCYMEHILGRTEHHVGIFSNERGCLQMGLPAIHWFSRYDGEISRTIFYNDLSDRVQSGTLPQYSFIEPRYYGISDIFPPNDQHPSHDVSEGLYLSISETVTEFSSKFHRWKTYQRNLRSTSSITSLE